MIIKRSMARCKFCGDIIESKYTHNYVTCSCGAIAVDGGHEYLRRNYKAGYKPDECFEDLSETEDGDPEPYKKPELTKEELIKFSKILREIEKNQKRT